MTGTAVTGTNALDVASYILEKRRGLTAFELQKLVYFAQAWSLAWDGQPLFNDDIQAWQNGPVVPRLFRAHKKRFFVNSVDGGAADRVPAGDRAKIDAVLDFYGGHGAPALVQMSHDDQPWQEARADLPPNAPSSALIPQQAMRRFYTVQQVLGSPTPTRPAAEVVEASLSASMEEASRQMQKWRRTLDWLAVR